jgi:NAD(P)-dependent dehydrogenase (short-subunit alcohol dehydrogenase family)
MIELSGKTVLVTGGSRGIGACAVRSLRRAGAEVVIHYARATEAAEALAAEVGADHCHLVQADLAADDGATALWREALAWHERIDVLVNNAGIYTVAPLDADLETWHRTWRETLQVNLMAAADLCREAIGHWRAKGRGGGGGILVNVASRAAFRGDAPDQSHYAASKGGLVALTRTLARAHAADKVLAYVVAPGFVRTEMAEKFVAEHGEEAAAWDIPMGEIAAPEDVGNIIAFLASGLAPHTTGATIDIGDPASGLRQSKRIFEIFPIIYIMRLSTQDHRKAAYPPTAARSGALTARNQISVRVIPSMAVAPNPLEASSRP